MTMIGKEAQVLHRDKKQSYLVQMLIGSALMILDLCEGGLLF